MNNQLLIALKTKLDSLAGSGGIGGEIKRNALKEELQFYVLNFIYHHPKYGTWTMYGGSALRICHDLNRMSVDLDFEINHSVTADFLRQVKTDIEKHFVDTYGFGEELLRVVINGTRGLELRFLIGEALNLGITSDQIIVKIDLNHFVVANTVHERIPVNRGLLAFVIKTYNMSALMASKIAAIFLRGERGVGSAVYREKGRDIYDLLWYMEGKHIPDLDYLTAKDVPISDLRQLFDKLTIRMNEVNDANLAQDLSPLFMDQSFIRNWLAQWRETYLRLFKAYNISTISELQSIGVQRDFLSDRYMFEYEYATEEGGIVRFCYMISDYWIKFTEGDLPIAVDPLIARHVVYSSNSVGDTLDNKTEERLHKYATLFTKKTEQYLKKTNRVAFGRGLTTKVIRMSATNLDRKEQIVLTRSALLSAELEDLLR